MSEGKRAARRLALSTSGEQRYLSDEGLRELHEAGIWGMEISFCSEVMDAIDLQDQVARARAQGVEVWSIHLPFYGLDIAALEETFRRRTIDYHRALMERAGAAGIRTAVIHTCLEPVKDADRAGRMERSKESLRELAGYAEQAGLVLAVEELPRSCLGNCSDEMLELLSADERLRVCFDSNHLLGEPSARFLPRMTGKIHTVHLSDYDFVNERHWLPGEGKIDWTALLDALDQTGYEGPLLYEVRQVREDGQPLTAADVAENFRWLREQ